MNGDVRLRVEGLMTERLLQRAIAEGAKFRSVRRENAHAIIIDADPESARIIAALCERFSLPCRVISCRGRNAMLRRLKRRSTLLAGALTFTLALSLFFSRIWKVDVVLTGGRNADVTSLESALTSMGVKPGMAKSSVEPSALQNALSAASPDFSFVGVQLQGVRLLVEAAPAVPAPKLYEIADEHDLVARCDGIIESVSVLSGAACVKPGDMVKRGQTLIRGDERISSEVSRSIAALGTVVARTWHEGTASAPLTFEEEIRTGNSSRSSELRLMNLSWPLSEGERYSSQVTEQELLPIGGLFLPLQIRRTTAYETHTRIAEADEAALKRQLSELAFAAAGMNLTQSHPEGCEITDRWIEYTRDAGILTARAVYETQTDIAVSRDALYQQGG